MEKRPSAHVKEAEEKLQQQYKQLQREWDAIKQSKRQLRRSSTDSRKMVKALQLLDSSPRNLMSSLQHRRSPSDGDRGGAAWKVKNGGLTVEEILRERRAAIQSGKLKGRRLFHNISSGWDGLDDEEVEVVRSVSSYDCDDKNENVGTKEGFSPPCYPCSAVAYSSSLSSSSSSSFVCDECIERLIVEEEEKVVTVAAGVENEKKEVSNTGGYGTRSRMVLMVWFVIGLTLCAIGMISMRTFGVYRDGNEIIPVPT